jgi:hypothetical protein
VVNDGAIDIGRSLARLLNYGFPIRPSLEIAGRDSYVGSDYIVVGDGSFHVTQAQGALPNLCEIRTDGDVYKMDYTTYPVVEFDLGSIVSPVLPGDRPYYLTPGTADTFELTESELEDFLSLENNPVVVDGKLQWSDTLELDSF